MSFLKRLFGKEEVLPPANLAALGADFHSHLIPGIDDGAPTVEDSLALIRELMSFGYKKLITTPHIMSDYYRNTPEIINAGLKTMQEAIAAEGLDVELRAAAEYYLDYEFEKLIEQKNILTLDGKHVLFEMPFMSEPASLSKVVFQLQMNGYKPVLAHPERYLFWHKEFEKYREIKEKGCILQLNLTSLSGHYSPQVKKIGERLIEEGLIGAVGSDCHNMSHIERIKIAQTNPYLHRLLESENLLNTRL